jgi:hypothetical protein
MIGHALCRPPRGSRNVKRLNVATGRWTKDNGEPSIAFIGEKLGAVAFLDPESPEGYVWIAICRCPTYAECVLSKALAHAGTVYDSTTVQRRPARSAPRKKPKR